MRSACLAVLLALSSVAGARELECADFEAPQPGCECAPRTSSPDVLPDQSDCFPAFASRIDPLSPERRDAMRGVSWHEGCPVPLKQLRLVTVSHWTPRGEVREGVIVVAKEHAASVLEVFRRLYRARFPIESMQPVEAFGGDDERSMAANNTSGFNCRPKAGGAAGTSRHALGAAIDLNPLWNPYVTRTRVSPEAGARWADRRVVRPGSVVPDGVAVRAFREAGWKWGGAWRSTKDYQHFSADGQ